MAAIAPAIMALLVNLTGFQFFLTPVHFPISPLLSSIVFTLAAYFMLIQIDIYPLKYRQIPTLLIRTYEFFVFLFFLEFGLCNIWFPLETYAFYTLSSIGEFLKRVALYSCIDSLIIMAQVLQHYVTGIVTSYVLSTTFLLFILHCTYLIDITLINNYGFGAFMKDAFDTFVIGVQLVLSNSACRWHTVGVRQEIRRQKKFRRFTKSSTSYSDKSSTLTKR